MNSKLEQTDVHMNKFLSHANVEEISSRPTTDVMEHKNEEIRELQMKLQTLVDKHNDLISHYEARMVYMVSDRELFHAQVFEFLK